MTAAEYPAIGFDPAPGKLESVEDLNSKLSRAATGLDNAYTTLTGITKGGKTWEGEAASAFAEKVGDLPRYVGDSRDALREASLQLSSWRSKLADYQQKAQEYEAQAKAAKEREKTGQGAYDRAASAYNQAAADPALRLAGQYYATQSELADAQARIDAASNRLNQAGKDLDSAGKQLESAQQELEDIIKRAEELLEHHQSDAGGVADRLRKANDKAPDAGFFEGLADFFTKVGHDIQNWCVKHADLLKQIGDWLSIASTVMGVLSLLTLWCPPLAGAFALAGGALSLGALATHGAAKLGGADVSAMDLIGDGLGVIPIGKLGKVAMKGVKIPMKLYKVNGRTIASIEHVTKIRALKNAGYTVEKLEGKVGLLRREALPGSKAVSAEGFGNRMKMAWDNHVLDTVGSSAKEKALSWAVEKFAPQSVKNSLGAAIRADGTLDPMSWWAKGPQVAQQAPGIVTGVYNMFDNSDTPAAGRL
ncbi:putative T7SS-secreted protein [Actinacidiphila glaucinigra]|uniref:putative T7SS-secreted protein n=1 Tax=Actinacidiphila glaucinigra TaxID=235986 RepID=UPI0037B2EFD8